MALWNPIRDLGRALGKIGRDIITAPLRFVHWVAREVTRVVVKVVAEVGAYLRQPFAQMSALDNLVWGIGITVAGAYLAYLLVPAIPWGAVARAAARAVPPIARSVLKTVTNIALGGYTPGILLPFGVL